MTQKALMKRGWALLFPGGVTLIAAAVLPALLLPRARPRQEGPVTASPAKQARA